MLSERAIERLIVYRRLLNSWIQRGGERIYSHELANLAGVTPAQVRRDIMAVNCAGNPARGYLASDLADRIGERLGTRSVRNVALVGIGNLGQALLAHFVRDSGHLAVVAAFDVDPAKTGRVLHGCHCYPIDDIERIIAREHVPVAILAVSASSAASVADRLVQAGITAILNLTPEHLRVPAHVRVENVDLGIALEKVAFYAGHRQNAAVQQPTAGELNRVNNP